MGMKRWDHKGKNNEKSFYTVSREGKKRNDENKVHAI